MNKNIILILSMVTLLFISGCSDDSASISFSPSPVDSTGSAVITQDFLLQVALGKVDGATVIHKFGSGEIDSSIHPVTQSQEYKTPTTPQCLEFISNSSADSQAGIGAREITINYINSTWQEDTQTIQTNGIFPVTLPDEVLRVYRWYVSSSGSYSSSTSQPHIGDLELRECNTGNLWSIISNAPLSGGQSQIGVYTIPKGKTGFLLSKNIFTDTSKSTDIYFFARSNADDITTPYSGIRRLVEREIGISGGISIPFSSPKGPYVGPTDIGFMGKVSVGTSDASVEFELLILDNEIFNLN